MLLAKPRVGGLRLVMMGTVFALLFTASGRAAGQAGAVLVLDTRPADEGEWFDSGVLLREVLRQALLVAARDELGLATRDTALGEPTIAGRPVMNLRVHAVRGDRCRLTLLTRGDGDEREQQMRLADIVWQPQDPADAWQRLLEAAEAHSRTEMVKLLRRARFEGQGNGVADERQLPAALESLLGRMDLFSQFEAARAAHTVMRESGESPAMLGALVRAYANLAMLTDRFWSPMHKAMGGRSLLYAQRWAVREPERPEPLWHRAYAWSAVGVPLAAQRDLEAADVLAGEVRIDEPTWLPLLRLAVAGDYAGMWASMDRGEANAALAGVLAVWTVEHHAGQSLTVSVTSRARQAAPQCLWLVDVMAGAAGVRLGHQVTMEGPELLAAMLRERLGEMAGLPTTVRQHLPQRHEDYRRARTRHALATALIDATREADAQQTDMATSDFGASGVSWAVLGTMIDEVNVVQIARRLHFEAHDLAWGREAVRDFTEHVLPAVQHHRYAAYFNSHTLDLPRQRDEAAALFRAIDAPDIGNYAQYLFWRAGGLGLTDTIAPLWNRRLRNTDATERDLWAATEIWSNAEGQRWLMGWLRGIGPDRPTTVRMLLHHAPTEEIDAHLDQWMRDYREHPAVLEALVAVLLQRDREADAIDLLEHWITIAPESEPIERLADIHAKRGDDALWLTTMQRRLAFPDHSLAHARTRDRIAWHHMRRGDFEAALPWAREAAQSWSGWSMSTLAVCCEGLGRLDEAEQWVARVSQRYEASALNWYVWCRRTGHGDVKAAAAYAAEHLAAVRDGDQAYALDDADRISVQLYDGDMRSVAAAAEAAYTSPKELWYGLMAATVCQQLGDTERRDALMARLLADCESNQWKRCVEMFNAVAAAWAGDADALPIDGCGELAVRTGTDMQHWSKLMLADALWRLERTEEATALLAEVLQQTRPNWVGYHWAWKLAESMALDPRQVRGWPDVAPATTAPAEL